MAWGRNQGDEPGAEVDEEKLAVTVQTGITLWEFNDIRVIPGSSLNYTLRLGLSILPFYFGFLPSYQDVLHFSWKSSILNSVSS